MGRNVAVLNFFPEFIKTPSRRLSDPGFDLLKNRDIQSRVEDSAARARLGTFARTKVQKIPPQPFKAVFLQKGKVKSKAFPKNKTRNKNSAKTLDKHEKREYNALL